MRSAPQAIDRIWHGHLADPAAVRDPCPVHPVRTVGAAGAQARTWSRAATCPMPPLSRRADRNQPCRRWRWPADQRHGAGAGARLRGAADLFHLHHPLDAAAGFLALHLHRLRRRGRAVRDGDVLSSRAIRRRAGAGLRLPSRPLAVDHPGVRRAGGRGRHAIAPAVRGQHHGRDRARPHHQSVRPARLAAGGRAADGGGQKHRQRNPPGRRHVRRLPQLYRGRAAPARRRKWWSGSTARSRCWSTSSIAMAAS